MSYDTSIKKQKATEGDNESLSDPLLSTEFKNSCQGIEASLSNLGYKIRELERFMEMIGTMQDNESLRVQILQTLKHQYNYYSNINSKNQNLKKEKVQAYNVNLDDMTKKFQAVSQKIKEKEQLFIELAQKGRDSVSIKIYAEVDNMDEVIQQRKKDITQIESIMQNINLIAKDIAMETQTQGEKVKRLDEHITSAQTNTKAGLGELQEAQTHQKKGQKCLIIILAITIVIIAIVLAAIFG
ncbi:syntaxin-12 [Stylonychia lemnae]|uniref:Syntaxin-12 n=1 Tax=Stylonychia lemnae TaxID=5949 RepID=A0A078BBD0_STYLE|nr:syntaxin-12 [Stylonychia lemnae]|eukprot:CDW91699.1 syntaxin-12 [Stylonychia lemnae]